MGVNSPFVAKCQAAPSFARFAISEFLGDRHEQVSFKKKNMSGWLADLVWEKNTIGWL